MVPGRWCIQKKYIPLRISPYTGQIRCVADNKINVFEPENMFNICNILHHLIIYPRPIPDWALNLDEVK